MMSRIFVPITGSDESKIAIDRAVEIAAMINAHIFAIYVLDNESIARLERYKIFVEEEASIFAESLKKDAQKYLDYAKNKGKDFHVHVDTVLLEGELFSEFKNFINEDHGLQKFVVIARSKHSDSFIEAFGVLEKKLLRSTLSVIVVGG